MSIVYKRSASLENETELENITLIAKPVEPVIIDHTQIFLRPDIVPVVIEMIKHFKWSTIYYIYNHEAG